MSTARVCILSALAIYAVFSALELRELRTVAASDKAMIAELAQFVEGEVVLIEDAGRYAVERSVQRRTYAVTSQTR